MIYVIHIFLSLTLFAGAFAGAIHSELPRKVRYLSFVYFGCSLAGQVLALPFLLLTLGSLLLALFKSPLLPEIVIINVATLALFASTLWRAWQGSQVLSQIIPHRQGVSVGHFMLGALLPLQLPKRNIKRLKNIAYGTSSKKNKLDIYMSKTKSLLPMPVLIHVHGGGWIVGQKNQQAKPLIWHMASKGWLVVDINYRLGPENKMPVMIQDVLQAVAWVKANIETYSGDPNFVALTGGSAGGHLVALASLASAAETLKPGFEKADCAVDACVPVYGVYNFLNRTDTMSEGFDELQSFLTKFVMPGSPHTHEALWGQVSPMNQIHPNAPPMLILHGRHDTLADFESAKAFAQALGKTSNNGVTFVALPGAQHAYDIAHAPPTPEHIRAIYRFLESTRREKNK